MKTMIKRVLSALLILCLLTVTFPLVSYAENTAKEEDLPILVSLGDSYSSGEGLGDYGECKTIEEKVKDLDWLAHRSKNCWQGKLKLPGVSGTLSEHRDTNWYFVACSGAKTPEMKKRQMRQYYRNEKIHNKSYPDHDPLIPAQLDVFKKIPKNTVDFVTVTIGGNDMGFANAVIKAAATPSISQAMLINPAAAPGIVGVSLFNPNGLVKFINDKWKEFETGWRYDKDNKEWVQDTPIKEKIRQAYKDIQEAAGPQATILVVGYPTLLAVGLDKKTYSLFSQGEGALLDDSCNRFDKELREIVDSFKNDASMNIRYVSVLDKFKNHEANSLDPYLFGVEMLNGTDENVTNKGMDKIVSSGSLHPNEKGAQVYTQCVQEAINKEVEKQVKASGGITSIVDKMIEQHQYKEAYQFLLDQVNLNPTDEVKSAIKNFEKRFTLTATQSTMPIVTDVKKYTILDGSQDSIENVQICLDLVDTKTSEAQELASVSTKSESFEYTGTVEVKKGSGPKWLVSWKTGRQSGISFLYDLASDSVKDLKPHIWNAVKTNSKVIVGLSENSDGITNTLRAFNWSGKLLFEKKGVFNGIEIIKDQVFYCQKKETFKNSAGEDIWVTNVKKISLDGAQDQRICTIEGYVAGVFGDSVKVGPPYSEYISSCKIADLKDVKYVDPGKTTKKTNPTKAKAAAGILDQTIREAEAKTEDLNNQLQNAYSQYEMSSIAYKLNTTWQDAMAACLKALSTHLSNSEYAALSGEQSAWEAQKDAKVEAEGAQYQGGSMQPYVCNMKSYELTKERVYALQKYGSP